LEKLVERFARLKALFIVYVAWSIFAGNVEALTATVVQTDKLAEDRD